LCLSKFYQKLQQFNHIFKTTIFLFYNILTKLSVSKLININSDGRRLPAPAWPAAGMRLRTFHAGRSLGTCPGGTAEAADAAARTGASRTPHPTASGGRRHSLGHRQIQVFEEGVLFLCVLNIEGGV